jgi:hypothetical protein
MRHPIPSAALAHHIAFLGKTGSGKSNGAKVIAEEALDAGERVCVVDPTGAWWGLRLKANGKPSNYPVVIFGGLHGDVAITGHQGAAVADVIATSATPAVIDTRLMTVGERTQFFTDFAETLLRKNRGPLRLILDEAHVFAPQGRVADPNSGKMLHAANNLVSLGRSIGLRIIMISQRPAKLHKDSLTQVETLVAMRLIAPQDRGAVEDWIGEWADKSQGKEIIASLPSLPTGDAWIWSPEADFLKRVHFPLARTYDSSKAPIAGEEGPELKPLDLASVNALLEKAAEDLKANDPRHLKAEVARLSRELAVAKATEPKGISPPAWPDQRDDVKRLATDNLTLCDRVGELERLLLEIQKIAADAAHGRVIPSSTLRVAESQSSPPKPEPRQAPRTNNAQISNESGAAGDVPSGCSKPLAVLAGVYPGGMTEAQWSTAAGYKRTGGTWKEYRSRLKRAEMIEQRGGLYYATDLGARSAGDVELPPAPGPELARWWGERISGTPKLIEVLIAEHPRPLSRAELGERLGMVPTGGTFKEYISRLKRNGIATESGGEIMLSPEVMGG